MAERNSVVTERSNPAGREPLLSWGVDGCPAGWFYFALEATGRYCHGVVKDLCEITNRADSKDLVLVDIPIGLHDAPRCCDVLARRKLGWWRGRPLSRKRSRASSVFRAPARAALKAVDAIGCNADMKRAAYGYACRLNKEATGKKLSRQTFSILPKVRAVDDLLSRDAKAREIVREVHPELCFWALNDRKPMCYNKRAKARAGFDERMAVLGACWKGAQAAADEICGCYPRKHVARDDVTDAMVAALTGRATRLELLPEQPPQDDFGLPMQMMWADKDTIQIG